MGKIDKEARLPSACGYEREGRKTLAMQICSAVLQRPSLTLENLKYT